LTRRARRAAAGVRTCQCIRDGAGRTHRACHRRCVAVLTRRARRAAASVRSCQCIRDGAGRTHRARHRRCAAVLTGDTSRAIDGTDRREGVGRGPRSARCARCLSDSALILPRRAREAARLAIAGLVAPNSACPAWHGRCVAVLTRRAGRALGGAGTCQRISNVTRSTKDTAGLPNCVLILAGHTMNARRRRRVAVLTRRARRAADCSSTCQCTGDRASGTCCARGCRCAAVLTRRARCAAAGVSGPWR
jgi:hypothetical protein